MIPCHCIIAHPEAAKFLVIKHGDGWSPPQLQVPEGVPPMYLASAINQGMMQKYGLRTTVLRCILDSRNYLCFELEMHASSQQEIEAVWMDRETYAQSTRQDQPDADPFDLWLSEREGGGISRQRSPWETAGWYRAAEHWMTDCLVHLGLQITGSVQQFRAGWPVSSILRVATASGQAWLKAGYQKPPGEARLVPELASRWPQWVAQPLAAEPRRNWLLMRDYGIKKNNRATADRYAEFASALATFQHEAAGELQTWRKLGCPEIPVGHLLKAEGEDEDLIARLEPLLSNGRRALDDGEMSRLREAAEAAGQAGERLEHSGLANTLCPLDYVPENWFVEDDQCRVLDWSDVAITHPFMAICRTLERLEAPIHLSESEAGLAESCAEAYLEAYGSSSAGEASREDLESARAVYPLFKLRAMAQELPYLEPAGPHDLVMRNRLKRTARELIESHTA